MGYEVWFKLDGVDGSVTEGARRGWSPTAGFSQSVQAHHGNGQPVQYLNVMRRMDRSTPILAKAAAEGRHFREAIFEVASEAGLLRVRLTDVTLQNYNYNASTGEQEAMPMESMAFEAGKAEWSFTPAGGREVKTSWPPEGAAKKPAEPAVV